MLDRTINLKLKVYDVAGFLSEVNLVLSWNLGNIFCKKVKRGFAGSSQEFLNQSVL